MTAPRLIMIGVVVVLTLYAVGAALTRRNAERKAAPGEGFSAWLGEVALSQSSVPPEELILGRCQFVDADRDKIVIPGAGNSTIEVMPNEKKTMRTLKLVIPPGAPRPDRVVYTPKGTQAEDGEVQFSTEEQVLFVRGSAKAERSVPVGPQGGLVVITLPPGAAPLEIALK